MTQDTTNDAPLDPRAMLDLIEHETERVRDAARRGVPWFYFSWGVMWLIGYLLLWAAQPDSGSPVAVALWVAVPVYIGLFVVAIAISAVVGVRMGRGIRGRSTFVGAVYGLSWPILGGAFAALGIALLQAGMDPTLAMLYYPSVYAFMVAALYLAGAMIWVSIDQLAIAVILAVAGSVAPFFGVPTNLLVMALAAGGALIAGGVITVISLRTAR
ncbi:MAG: hypothetical protein ABI435_06730 [Pseudolysinimonas sp.]